MYAQIVLEVLDFFPFKWL